MPAPCPRLSRACGRPPTSCPCHERHASFEGKRTCGKRTCGNKYCYLGHAHGRLAPRGARESVGRGAGAPRRPSSSAKTTLLWLPGAMQQRGSRDMGGGRGGKQRVNEIFGDMDFWIYQLKRLYRPIRPAVGDREEPGSFSLSGLLRRAAPRPRQCS